MLEEDYLKINDIFNDQSQKLFSKYNEDLRRKEEIYYTIDLGSQNWPNNSVLNLDYASNAHFAFKEEETVSFGLCYNYVI